jgi:hypothetical protein
LAEEEPRRWVEGALASGGGWLVKTSGARAVFKTMEMRPEEDWSGPAVGSLRRQLARCGSSWRLLGVVQLDTRTGFQDGCFRWAHQRLADQGNSASEE